VSTMKVRRLGFALGAEITGVDLSTSPDDATVAAIRQAYLDHIVLCLPDQHLNPAQFRDFCARFGVLDDNRESPNRDPDSKDLIVLANQPTVFNGKEVASYATAATQWHSDYSISERPGALTFLLAETLPEVGGDTAFANMYMAYEALSPTFRAMLEPLQAVHDYTLGRGFQNSTPEKQAKARAMKQPVVHAVVKVHPETGRKALYFSDRVRQFVGMSEEETKPIIDFLQQHATRYEFTYRHRWSPNDLIMWDNRALMHIAVQDYDRRQLRRMLRCTMIGERTGRTYVPERELVSS
jgi:taurine dioxygenase